MAISRDQTDRHPRPYDVGTGSRWQARTEQGDHFATGVIAGYSQHPQVLIRTADGDGHWWRADLVTPNREEPDVAIVTESGKAALRDAAFGEELIFEPRLGWYTQDRRFVSKAETTSEEAQCMAEQHEQAAQRYRQIAARADEVNRDPRVEKLGQVFIEAAGLIATMGEQKVTTQMVHYGIRAVLAEIERTG